MALTRPKAAQINFDLTNISDPVIRLNSDKTDANDTDVGFIFERGSSGDNAVLVWDESADQFVVGTTTASGTTSGDLTITNGNLQVDTIKNREQRYTTSNMMKFNQLYTGAAIGSYFEQNEYQKIVTIIPSGNSENYQVSGRILCQNAGEIQTINFKAALRSGDPLPDLSWSITYDQEHNGTAHFKPQLWTKETTTAGFIVAIQKISSGSLYGTVTVDLDVIPRTSALLDNVTVNTTQDSEQTTVDTGYTANDMTLVRSISGSTIQFAGAYAFPTSDGTNGQVLSTNGSGALSFESLAATDVTVSANNTTDETTYITFVDGATGSQGLETDTGLTYNPSTNTLTTSVFSGTATTAQYADLAENYVADEQYEPGTVLIFGGQQEVTASRQPDSNKIAGVVSTAPGVLMNKDCEGEFVVALAFTGRVPTKVKGTISKGDMMVSSNIEGVAVASDNPAIGTVIGKALENYDSEEVGVIEVVVGRL